MNLKFLLKSTIFLLCSSLCLAGEYNEENDKTCRELIEKSYEDGLYIKDCGFDNNNNINYFVFEINGGENFDDELNIISKYNVHMAKMYVDDCFDTCRFDMTPFKSIDDLTLYLTTGRFHYHRKLFDLQLNSNLKKFSIRKFILTQKVIDGISSIKGLTELNIMDCELEDGVSLEPLKKLENISSLGIYLDYNTRTGYSSDIDTLPLEFPEIVYSFSNLKNLDVTTNNLEKSGEELLKLKNLEKLDITCVGDNCRFKKDIFTEFKNLKELTINGFDLTQDLIDDLTKLPNLKQITFDGCYNLAEVDLTPVSKIIQDNGFYNDTYPKICHHDPDHCVVNKTKTTTTTKKSSTKVSSTITTTTKKSSTKVSTTTTSKKTSAPTSTKGKCGKDYGKCPSGECCSKYGYCGKTDEYCGSGCQSEFGQCQSAANKTTTTTKKSSTVTSLPTSKNGKCGKKDGQCPSGECCSKYGYCGRSDAHCGAGCQSEFGQCKSTSTTSKKTTSTTTTKKSSSLPTTTNGKCGKENGKCPSGECCSKYGYCGRSDAHCGTGCQSEFGQCNSSGKDTKTSTNGKCGKENGKCPSGECCSKYGYCGRSDAHCGAGCQSEFGQCNSSSKDSKTSTKGKCGKDYGKCPSGECCSKYGYCGKSDAYCGKGCQSEFGKCQ